MGTAGRVAGGIALAAVLAACGATDAHPVDPDAITRTNTEVAELEISGTGIDRFARCPPPGELGQGWMPPVPPWHPAAAASASPAGSSAAVVPPLSAEEAVSQSSPTERAITDTHEAFRACWHHSLIHDPTQDGHVAVVLRVGGEGTVAKVESYGACNISSEAIQCMMDATRKLRFRPPEGGAETIIIPAVFTSSEPLPRTNPRSSDVYAAAAFLAVEKLRPALHLCESSARASGRPGVASATFALDVDGRGKVVHSNVDPWSGDKDLLTCAAAAFEGGAFPVPPGGQGSIVARIAFNPRMGTK